jgi:hypothetical protein
MPSISEALPEATVFSMIISETNDTISARNRPSRTSADLSQTERTGISLAMI